MLGSRLPTRDFHRGEVRTDVPEWEGGNLCDLVMKQLVNHQ